MTETIYTWTTIGRLFFMFVAGSLYTMAGRGWKIPILGKIRRSVWLPILLCLSWLIFGTIEGVMTWILALACLATIGLSYGIQKAFAYGSSSWLRKIFGRIAQQFIVGFVHGLANCILPAVVLAIYGAPVWGVVALSCLLPCLSLGILGGIFDNDLMAAKKEGLVGATEYLPPLFIV